MLEKQNLSLIFTIIQFEINDHTLLSNAKDSITQMEQAVQKAKKIANDFRGNRSTAKYMVTKTLDVEHA